MDNRKQLGRELRRGRKAIERHVAAGDLIKARDMGWLPEEERAERAAAHVAVRAPRLAERRPPPQRRSSALLEAPSELDGAVAQRPGVAEAVSFVPAREWPRRVRGGRGVHAGSAELRVRLKERIEQE